jgi:hypothetical protein
LEPSGILRDAAMVTPCIGGLLFAHIPFAFGPQQSLQAQYAVIVALIIFVIISMCLF